MLSTYLKLIFVLILLGSTNSFAYFNYSNCYTTETAKEAQDLQWTTPWPTVVLASVPTNFTAAIFMMSDPRQNVRTGLSMSATFMSLIINGGPFLGLIFAHRIHKCQNVEQVTMLDDERAELRKHYLKNTYWFGGIEMFLAASMLTGARTDAAIISSSVALAVPLITTLIQFNKLKRGPYKDSEITAFNFSPMLLPQTNLSTVSGIQIALQF